MSGRRWIELGAVLLFALATLQWTAVPAAAQTTGNDDVTFWDDSPAPGSPNVPQVAPTGYHYLNPTGGRNPDDGLLTIVGEGRYQIVRDRDWQTFNPSAEGGTQMWLIGLDLAGTEYCIGPSPANGAPMNKCTTASPVVRHYWNSVTLSNTSANSVKMTMTANLTTTTVTLEVTSSYDPLYPYYVSHSAKLSASGTDANQLSDINLYLGGDMYLDGNDEGAGAYTNWKGKSLIAQVGETSVGGIRASGAAFSSYIADGYGCFYGLLYLCNLSSPELEGKRGPGANEPLANYVNPDPTTDTSIGAHWTITSLPKTIAAQFMFISRSGYDDPPTDPTEEPTDGGTPATCNTPPTLAIKPDTNELAPGAATTVWVELANQCRDLPTAEYDVLLSFSDGMQVLETSAGAINFGQRAAMQRLSLPADATYGWYAIVRNDGPQAATPLAVAEIYAGAAVVRKIDIAFSVPAAPTVLTAPVVEAAPPAPAPAAPAPLPNTLPNTAEPFSPLPLLLLVSGLLLLVAGLSRLRRRT